MLKNAKYLKKTVLKNRLIPMNLVDSTFNGLILTNLR